MGEAKRRKATLGDHYGQQSEERVPVLGISKDTARQFVKWSTRGAWIGIGLLLVFWLTVRFIGPALGWWQLNA